MNIQVTLEAVRKLRGLNVSLRAISNLFERSEFLIWLLYLEMFQPLSLSYSRKPEPECSVQKMAAKCANAFSPLMLQALSVKLLKLSIALFAKLLLLELLVFIHLATST